MKDRDKNKQQLIEELVELRRQVAAGKRALQESETAAALLQVAPLGIHECDTEGRITFVNPSQEAITGYPAEELLGSYAWDRIVPGPDKDSLPAVFKHLVAEQPPPTPYVNKNIRKNGEVFDVRVDWNYKRNPLGQVTGFVCIVSDVTEQKRAEEALRESEDRYRTLAESTTDIIYILDESGTLRYGNRSAAAYMGLSPASLVGKTQQDLFPPEIAERHLQRVRTAFETGEPEEMEELYRFGSQDVWLNVRSIPLRDEQGRVTSVMGVCRDISDRKRADVALRKAHDELEQRVQERTAELREANACLQREVEERRRAEGALRESHDQLRAIYEGMVDGILLTDIETMRLVRANAAICRMLGYSETELLSLGVSDIHPADALPPILENIRSAEKVKQTPFADVPFAKTEAYSTRRSSVRFLTYDAKPCSMGIFRDITERKRAEAAIAESEAKYRRLVETTDTGYLILDDEGRVVDANTEYIRLCGRHDLSEIVGRSVKEWTAPHDVDRNGNEVVECLRAGFVRQLEVEYIHPDGSIMPVEINATCTDTQDGTWILSLCRDITERRQARDALERERRTLEHMLRASDHERRLIAYDIHDGLAQELAGAIMQSEIHEQFKQSKPDEAKKAYDGGLTLLRQAHTEARRLISGVRPPILDESGVVAAIAHLVRDPAFDHGPKIDFRSRVTFNRLTPAAENMVYRIVQEGLTNARTHSGSKRVVVSLLQRGDRLRIEVRDWGVGFDRKAVPKNRFGLEGIRERARLLGGKATIETGPGEGTRVVVDLPIVLRRPEDEEPVE